MRWRGRRQSDNIQDSRGQGGGMPGGFGRNPIRLPIGRSAGGGGLSGIIILVVLFFVLKACGIDPMQILAGGGGGGVAPGGGGQVSAGRGSGFRRDEAVRRDRACRDGRRLERHISGPGP